MLQDLISWMLAYFTPQKKVEFLIAIQIWSYRIHKILHQTYERKYGNFDQAARFKRSSRGSGDNSDWDWCGVPRIPRGFIIFEYFTNCYYVFVLLKNVVPNYLHTVIGWLQLPMEPHCYLLGHFVSHELLEPHLVLLFTMYQVVWRLVLYLYHWPHMSSLYVFLSMTDRDLKRFHALIEAEQDKSSADIASTDDQKRNLRRLCRRTSLNKLNGRESIFKPLEWNDATNARVERLFKSALCYKSERNSVTYYKIKPNRTLEARQILRRQLTSTALIVVATFSMATIMVQTYVHWNILSPRHYARIYPNCGHNLKLSLSTGQIVGDVSFPFTWHHIISIVWDSLENIILWFETGYSLIICWAATYLLNYDTELYCSRLRHRLGRVHNRVVEEHQARLVAGMKLRLSTTALAKLEELAPLHHDDDIQELLFEIFDFFRHIQDVDLIVSDVITYTIAIWLSMFAVIGQSPSVRKREFHDPLFVSLVVFLESFTYIIFTVGCFSLLNLHRDCQRAYKTVCSVIALDTSSQKKDLSHLVEFFFVSRRSTYTVFQQYPFTRTTYISIVGWSFSCFFIIDGILSP